MITVCRGFSCVAPSLLPSPNLSSFTCTMSVFKASEPGMLGVDSPTPRLWFVSKTIQQSAVTNTQSRPAPCPTKIAARRKEKRCNLFSREIRRRASSLYGGGYDQKWPRGGESTNLPMIYAATPCHQFSCLLPEELAAEIFCLAVRSPDIGITNPAPTTMLFVRPPYLKCWQGLAGIISGPASVFRLVSMSVSAVRFFLFQKCCSCVLLSSSCY